MKPVHTQSSIIALDLLRAAAAIAVYLGHVRGASFVEFGALPIEDQGLPAKIFFGVTRLGHEAVMVFFVLSGFLVGGQILRHVKGGRFNIGSYAIDRSTRIFLPLIPAVILTVCINWFAIGSPPDWLQAISNGIGLNGVATNTLPSNAPLWTLAFEIWFYIVGGAIGLLLTRKYPHFFAVLALMCGILVFTVLSARYLLFWSIGAFSALLIEHPRRDNFALLGLFSILIGLVCYQLAAESKSFFNMVFLPRPLSEGLICVGMCLMLPYCCDERTNQFLRAVRKPASYLSALSYSLYLFHYPLNAALEKVFPKSTDLSASSIELFIVRVIIIWLAITIIYLAFEANTEKLRGFLKRRWLSRPKPEVFSMPALVE